MVVFLRLEYDLAEVIIVPVGVDYLHQVLEYLELLQQLDPLHSIVITFSLTSLVVVKRPSHERYSRSIE